jgi:hypothetical protein
MLDAYRDLIDELLATPAEIRGVAAANTSDPALSEMRHLIVELRDRDRTLLGQIQTMREREVPYLRATSRVASEPERDLASLLDEMELARGDLVSTLINLTLRDWERGAIDEVAGEVTVADLVERHVDFDEAQRARFRQLSSE